MSKAKIFDATCELIDQKGIEISVRDIAKAADVNVASINYHYQSKDNLIKEVIAMKMQETSAAFDLLENENPIVGLTDFLCTLTEFIEANPAVSTYMINQADLFKTRYEYQNYLQAVGYENLVNCISKITNSSDEEFITIVIEHLLSACILNYIKEKESANHYEAFYATNDYQKRIEIYITHYFNMYINNKGA